MSGARVYTSIVDADATISGGCTVGKARADKNDITVIAKGTVVNTNVPEKA